MGNDTYEKRQRERVALAATKAKEKEMKEEKKAEQLVCFRRFRQVEEDELCSRYGRLQRRGTITDTATGENHQAQGQARCEGGEGEI